MAQHAGGRQTSCFRRRLCFLVLQPKPEEFCQQLPSKEPVSASLVVLDVVRSQPRSVPQQDGDGRQQRSLAVVSVCGSYDDDRPIASGLDSLHIEDELREAMAVRETASAYVGYFATLLPVPLVHQKQLLRHLPECRDHPVWTISV